MRFRKNPLEIEALQFTGQNLEEMRAFCGTRPAGYNDNVKLEIFNPIGTFLSDDWDHPEWVAELWVDANKAHLPIEVGEWVIKDSLGFYPCKEAKFAETYTPVDDGVLVSYQDLPVFMPGNNRNWHRVDAKLTVDESGRIELQLSRDELHEELLRQWREGILLQVSFDYRTPAGDIDKINQQFAKNVPADDMEVGSILSDAGVRNVGDVLRLLKFGGIKFMKEK